MVCEAYSAIKMNPKDVPMAATESLNTHIFGSEGFFTILFTHQTLVFWVGGQTVLVSSVLVFRILRPEKSHFRVSTPWCNTLKSEAQALVLGSLSPRSFYHEIISLGILTSAQDILFLK